MKWILLLAIIVIIQYGKVTGYLPKMIFENHTPIPADRNKLKSPESNCKYCHLSDIIRTVHEKTKKIVPTVGMFEYPVLFKLFESILLPHSARSPKTVKWTRYLSNSFNDSLARIKEKLDVLERYIISLYKHINKISQETEANKEKEQEIGEILLSEKSSKYEFLFDYLSNRLMAKSVLYYLSDEFDDDIDYIKNNLRLLKTDYERVIDNIKNIEVTRKKEQQTGHMFVHHGSLFDEPIKDMIHSRSIRSPDLINSNNDTFAFIRITLDSLEMNYEYINRLLQNAEANKEKGEQSDQISLIEESSKLHIPFYFESQWIVETVLPHWKTLFDRDMADIEGNLGLLKFNYENVTDILKKIIDVKEANSQKDKKDPSPSESIVSNNNTQENVTQTIPTTDESTNTQKPVPTEHDDKKDKLVGEKDPLHTPEIAPNNKTPENIIIPIESTIIENLELTTIKNEDYFEQFEQEAKKDTFASIKNDSNEKVEPSITVDKEILINPFNPKDSIALEELRKLLLEKD